MDENSSTSRDLFLLFCISVLLKIQENMIWLHENCMRIVHCNDVVVCFDFAFFAVFLFFQQFSLHACLKFYRIGQTKSIDSI